MTSSKEGYDSKRLRDLASVMMDGLATQDEREELTELLRVNANARDEYLAFVDMHAVLSTELTSPASKPSDKPVEEIKLASAAEPSSRGRSKTAAWMIAIAASLLIAASWFFMQDEGFRQDATPQQITSNADAAYFASIAQVSNATWVAKGEHSVGDRLGAETIRLESGFAQLSFDDGVEVTLQGPAEYSLITVGRTKLMSGLLTATVPPGAEGFTVETPTAEVVDLGTSFGVDLRENGFSRVSVFEGEVEVAASEALEKQLLTEGQSVRIGSDREIEKIDFDPDRYARLWPIASGIIGSSDVFRFIPPWPKRLAMVNSDDDIFIAPEGHSIELNNSLDLNISQPGRYDRTEQLTPSQLEAGTRIRSYILHYAPVTKIGPRRAKRLSGSITFSNPVRGLIVQHEELLASSRRFTWRGAGEGQLRRELNLTGDSTGDRITLSEDRKTVTVDVISPGKSSDLIRVIVDGIRRPKPPRRRRR